MCLRLVALVSFATLLWGQPARKPTDFQREIRPILSDNCFACHGPDSSTRMAGLRLDRKEAAFEARKTGAAIVPGKPDESLLYQRISDPKPVRRMPPPTAHKTLTPAQIATIKRWIEQGARGRSIGRSRRR